MYQVSIPGGLSIRSGLQIYGAAPSTDTCMVSSLYMYKEVIKSESFNLKWKCLLG